MTGSHIARERSETSLDPSALRMRSSNMNSSSSSSSRRNSNSNSNMDSTENNARQRNVERRGSVDILQKSLGDVLDRRRRLSMDACEHIINKPSSGASNKIMSPHPNRLPPRPACKDQYLGADDRSFEEDTTEPSSDCNWIDNEEMTTSSSSVNHHTAERNERPSSRGRGLFRGLSRKLKPNEFEEDWATVSEDLTRSVSTSSTNNNYKQNNAAAAAGSTGSAAAGYGSAAGSDGSQSKRFLLQKVDSIRMGRIHRKEAKRTALEDSLMQQLSKMQFDHEGEMQEFALKLYQREAAIKTLESALTIKTEIVDSLRSEMEVIMKLLKETEAKLKKRDKKLAKKQDKKQDSKQQLNAQESTAQESNAQESNTQESNAQEFNARARSSSPSAVGEISSRRRLKEKKPSERNLYEHVEPDLPQRSDLRTDTSVPRSMEVGIAALRRNQSDHPRRRTSGSSDTSSLVRPTKSEHRRPSAVQQGGNGGEGDSYLDETRRSNSSNDEHQSTASSATGSDRRRRSSIEEKRQAQRRDSFDDLAGRHSPRRKSIDQLRRRPSSESDSAFSSRSCMDSRTPSRTHRNDDLRSRSRGAIDSRSRAADSRGRAEDSRGRVERQRRDYDEQQRVFNSDTPEKKQHISSLEDKIEHDRVRADRRINVGRPISVCRTEATNGSRRSAVSGSRSCVEPRRQPAHHDDGEPRFSSNFRPMRTQSRGPAMQRSDSSRVLPRPITKP